MLFHYHRYCISILLYNFYLSQVNEKFHKLERDWTDEKIFVLKTFGPKIMVWVDQYFLKNMICSDKNDAGLSLLSCQFLAVS